MTDWRPIETAPKDGTRILSWSVGTTKHFAGYAVVAWSTRDCVWFLDDDGDRGDVIGLTHWHPLPPPPRDAPK